MHLLLLSPPARWVMRTLIATALTSVALAIARNWQEDEPVPQPRAPTADPEERPV